MKQFSYKVIKPSILTETKHKGAQSQNKYVLEIYKNCLEKNKTVFSVNFSFRRYKREISTLKNNQN